MNNLLLKWLVTALSLLVVAEVLPGFEVTGFATALVSALLLGVVNITLKPVLYILTLPINVLTLGLFSFILNAFFFYFVAALVEGFSITGFWQAIFGAIIVSLLASLVDLKGNSNNKND